MSGVDMPCGQCGHTGAVHFSGDKPDALTKQTAGCCYHDGEGPCLCSGWMPEAAMRPAFAVGESVVAPPNPCAECRRRAEIARQAHKVGFVICAPCAMKRNLEAPPALEGKPRVMIESPYGKRVDGSTCAPEEIEANVEYFWRCVEDSIKRGEAPFGSHGFYPRVLDDGNPDERLTGIMCGFAWAEVAQKRAFYIDRGETPGMRLGYADAVKRGQDICYRRIE